MGIMGVLWDLTEEPLYKLDEFSLKIMYAPSDSICICILLHTVISFIEIEEYI